MLAKLSVDRMLIKARSHAKKGEVVDAQKLYQVILKTFPKNKKAQQEFLSPFRKVHQDPWILVYACALLLVVPTGMWHPHCLDCPGLEIILCSFETATGLAAIPFWNT